MSSCFQVVTVSHEVNPDGLAAWANWLIAECQNEPEDDYGVGGTFGVATGVDVRATMTPLANKQAADDFIWDTPRKGGPIVIIPYLDRGDVLWRAGCWCAA